MPCDLWPVSPTCTMLYSLNKEQYLSHSSMVLMFSPVLKFSPYKWSTFQQLTSYKLYSWHLPWIIGRKMVTSCLPQKIRYSDILCSGTYSAINFSDVSFHWLRSLFEVGNVGRQLIYSSRCFALFLLISCIFGHYNSVFEHVCQLFQKFTT